jgi:hypothetical protein
VAYTILRVNIMLVAQSGMLRLSSDEERLARVEIMPVVHMTSVGLALSAR